MCMRYAFFGICAFFLLPGMAHAQKTVEVDALLSEFYNNFNSVEKNRAVKEGIERLIEQYPDDPYLYSFWASVEWILTGHELKIEVSDRQNISEDKQWAKRLKTYTRVIDKGLTLTKEKTDHDSFMARAELLFEKSKLQYRFFGDLRGADRTTAELIAFLQNRESCHNYFFWGSARFGLSTQGILTRAFIPFLSYTYEALKKLDTDVYNIEKSVEWLEHAYRCGYDTPSRKKLWIETAFFLANAHESRRQNHSVREELPILEKQISILGILTLMFPGHQKVVKHYEYLELRKTTLKNFLGHL